MCFLSHKQIILLPFLYSAAELSQALVRMEMKYLASELAQKHG